MKLHVTLDRWRLVADVPREAPLGWRFWTLAGFPSDPIDPRPYGGSRCITMAQVELEGQARWLCAMERDESFALFTSHELFPCPAQDGASEFAHRMIARYAVEPPLF